MRNCCVHGNSKERLASAAPVLKPLFCHLYLQCVRCRAWIDSTWSSCQLMLSEPVRWEASKVSSLHMWVPFLSAISICLLPCEQSSVHENVYLCLFKIFVGCFSGRCSKLFPSIQIKAGWIKIYVFKNNIIIGF